MKYSIILILLTLIFIGCSKEDIPSNELVPQTDGITLGDNQSRFIVDDELLLRDLKTELSTSNGLVYTTALKEGNCKSSDCEKIYLEFSLMDEGLVTQFLDAKTVDIASPRFSIFHVNTVTSLDSFAVRALWETAEGSVLEDSTGVTLITSDNRVDYRPINNSAEYVDASSVEPISQTIYECDLGFEPFEVFEVNGRLRVRLSQIAKEERRASWVHTGSNDPINVTDGIYTINYFCETTNRFHTKEIEIFNTIDYRYTLINGDIHEQVDYPIAVSINYVDAEGRIFRSDWSEDREAKMKIKEDYLINYLEQSYHILNVELSLVLRNEFGEFTNLEFTDALIYLKEWE